MKIEHRRVSTGVLAGILFVLLSPGAASAQAQTCESLTGLSLPHVTITSAATVAATATVPAYCLVTAISMPTSDSHITILVALPIAGWNGKYLQLGNGGFAGSVAPPVAAVQRGYAGAATDNGHQASGLDASWAVGHPEKVVDFGYRSLKETTDVAKAVIAAFYGAGPDLSYFQGCSDGGREALMEAQRYPEDWDGIVVGAPANFWTHLFTGFIWNDQALTLDPASAIPESKLPAIQAAALGACDASDQVIDGVVGNPLECNFDPHVLLCQGAETDQCITQAQLDALIEVMSGPRNPRTGGSIFPGYTMNAVAFPAFAAWIFTTALGLPKPIQFIFGEQFYTNMVFEDPSWDYRTLDFDADVAFADAKLAAILNSTDPTLDRKGPKIIMWHGWEDPAISARNSIHYYADVVAAQRPGRGRGAGEDWVGLHRTRSFFRLFMVPGMLHCGGGPGPNVFDALSALERWVEGGDAPDRIIATKYVNDNPAAGVLRTRPLCPFPEVAEWTGQASTDAAESFVCVVDPVSLAELFSTPNPRLGAGRFNARGADTRR